VPVQSGQLSQLPGFSPFEGIRMCPLFGERAMLNWIELAPGSVVPLHSHDNEQLGFVISGQITLTIGGEEHVLREGDGYTMPGGIEHQGVAGPEGCVVVDVFAPVREDYRAAVAAPQP
jgi:quercetin dioxygenase-like cupin family protein